MSSSVGTEPLCVRAREAAKMLSISERTLWGLTKSGQVPVARIGTGKRKTLLYRIAVLEEWLSRHSASRA